MRTGIIERKMALAARCTNAARDQLEEVCAHRLYPEILARLESIRGKLFEIDIERALYQALKEERRTPHARRRVDHLVVNTPNRSVRP